MTRDEAAKHAERGERARGADATGSRAAVTRFVSFKSEDVCAGVADDGSDDEAVGKIFVSFDGRYAQLWGGVSEAQALAVCIGARFGEMGE